MSTKLFVGGLPWAMDTQRLKEVFAEFGDLVDARVITDRETGRSRGFGFVTFGSPEGAERAIALDGQEVDGRRIRVDRAQEKERPPRGPGGPGGGGGGRPPRDDGGGPPRSFDGPPRSGDRPAGGGAGAGPGKPKPGRGGGGDRGGGGGFEDDYRRKPDKAGRGRRKGGRGGRGGGGEGGFGEDDYDY